MEASGPYSLAVPTAPTRRPQQNPAPRGSCLIPHSPHNFWSSQRLPKRLRPEAGVAPQWLATVGLCLSFPGPEGPVAVLGCGECVKSKARVPRGPAVPGTSWLQPACLDTCFSHISHPPGSLAPLEKPPQLAPKSCPTRNPEHAACTFLPPFSPSPPETRDTQRCLCIPPHFSPWCFLSRLTAPSPTLC